MIIRIVFMISCLLAVPTLIFAVEPLHVGKFNFGDLSDWTDKEFKGKTTYRLVTNEGKSSLKAQSVKAASGLVKKVNIDPKRFPLLRWTWKIDNLIQKEDVAKKNGDDFSARVYVIFPRSFWRMRAINYVWSAKMPKGSSAPSPYTGNSMIVAVESGKDKLGQWLTEERNVFEDYRKLFGEDPPEIGGIAVMTDTDDTQEEATAYYGDIFVYPKKTEEPPIRTVSPQTPAKTQSESKQPLNQQTLPNGSSASQSSPAPPR